MREIYLYHFRAIAVFPVFRLLTDFFCLLTYEFCLSLLEDCSVFGNFVITLIYHSFKCIVRTNFDVYVFIDIYFLIPNKLPLRYPQTFPPYARGRMTVVTNPFMCRRMTIYTNEPVINVCSTSNRSPVSISVH